ncbi:MAG: asparagine synthase (glutamine-hydrolyzing) [Proteobacteria bacterium]|nr:asparagine synthase (glutamine-hydrolyzing) [Pseudomonadota bacterium]
MCGILGLAGVSRPADVTRALGLIAHRGPDGSGVWADADVTLGHCRLAIIDLAGGAQPFVSPDSGNVIVFNGEIYNFRDLARELKAAGVTVRTASDTEILLHWIDRFGIDGLARLNGMFALAHWDVRRRRLLLARDRLGMKPLYVHARRGKIAFSSEIKALLPWMPAVAADRAALLEHATFQNVLSDRTYFEGVRKLAPGGWLEWTPEATRDGAFWSPAFDERDVPFGDAVEDYRARLDRAMDRHMIADTSVGAYLSSGIDSGSVATLAAPRYAATLKTFTGAFGDAAYYDERPGARAIAGRIGADAYDVVVGPDDFVHHMPDVAWHMDEPALGTGALGQYVVSRLVGRHVKVVLTGHGGDELFAGYQVNRVALFRDALRGSPLDALRAIAGIRPDEISRVLYFLLYPLLSPEIRHGLFIMTPGRRRRQMLAPEMLAEIAKGDPLAALEARLGARKLSCGQSLTYLYLRTYLPTLFIQEDKVGMAHSIEARMPLCDNELVDLSLSLPLATKMHGGALKAIPKAAMRGRLPEQIWGMPKRGFPTPFARWFRAGPAREFVRDLLLSPTARNRGLFASDFVRREVAANDSSSTDNLFDYARASTLYSAAATELWYRTFADGDALAGRAGGMSIGEFAGQFA